MSDLPTDAELHWTAPDGTPIVRRLGDLTFAEVINVERDAQPGDREWDPIMVRSVTTAQTYRIESRREIRP